MSAATQNEVERLRRERDQARDERDALSIEHAAMDQERSRERLARMKAENREQALAAHVEMLCCGIDACIESDWAVPAEEALGMARDESPNESLARLKAEWRAEVLEELIQNTSQFREGNPVRGLAGSMADELRRQSEGGEA